MRDGGLNSRLFTINPFHRRHKRWKQKIVDNPVENEGDFIYSPSSPIFAFPFPYIKTFPVFGRDDKLILEYIQDRFRWVISSIAISLRKI